jgi:predicted transglutaminase-like cysteine proteinase
MRTSGGASDGRIVPKARSVLVAAGVTMAVTLSALPAFGFLARPVIFAKLGAVTKPPSGWLRFCAENPQECRPSDEGQRDVTLTPDLLQQLYSINAYANDRVKWTPDIELYGKSERWAYPLDRGDCEDIVLLKRRLLAAAGWPISALLIATVDDHATGIGRHAVLTVRTDRGELILDNLTPEILFWYETDYRFLTRQSTADPNVWMAFSADQPRPHDAAQSAKPSTSSSVLPPS